MTANPAGRRVREAKPGELCVCGQPARVALVCDLGDVPTCTDPATYADEIARRHRLANAARPHGAGSSGGR